VPATPPAGPAPPPAPATPPAVPADAVTPVHPEPAMAAPTPPEPDPDDDVEHAVAPTSPIREVDPFAGLPRLSRWVDPFDDDPAPSTESGPAASGAAAADTETGRAHAVPDPSDPTSVPGSNPAAVEPGPRYVGRRRQADGEPGPVVHVVPDSDPTPTAEDETSSAAGAGRRRARDDAPENSGGRRRRRDDAPDTGGHTRPELVPDDVLARLLGR
ncbi:hypothetical protein ACXR2U_24015, partial [Jatrophihabitans sp. YIM 134969]